LTSFSGQQTSFTSLNKPTPKPTRKKEKRPKREREGFIKVIDQEEKEGMNIEGKGMTSIGKNQSKGKETEIEKRGHQRGVGGEISIRRMIWMRVMNKEHLDDLRITPSWRPCEEEKPQTCCGP